MNAELERLVGGCQGVLGGRRKLMTMLGGPNWVTVEDTRTRDRSFAFALSSKARQRPGSLGSMDLRSWKASESPEVVGLRERDGAGPWDPDCSWVEGDGRG